MKYILYISLIINLLSCTNNGESQSNLHTNLIPNSSIFNLNTNNRFDSKNGLFSLIFKDELKNTIRHLIKDSIIEIRTHELNTPYELLLNNVSTIDIENNIFESINTFHVHLIHDNKEIKINYEDNLIIEMLLPSNLKFANFYQGEIKNGSIIWNNIQTLTDNDFYRDTSDTGQWNYVNGKNEGSIDSVKLYKRTKHYDRNFIFDQVLSYKPKSLQWFSIGRNIDIPLDGSKIANVIIDQEFNDLSIGVWLKDYNSTIILRKVNSKHYKSPIPIPKLNSLKVFCFGNIEDEYYIGERKVKYEEISHIEAKFNAIEYSEIPFKVNELKNSNDH